MSLYCCWTLHHGAVSEARLNSTCRFAVVQICSSLCNTLYDGAMALLLVLFSSATRSGCLVLCRPLWPALAMQEDRPIIYSCRLSCWRSEELLDDSVLSRPELCRIQSMVLKGKVHWLGLVYTVAAIFQTPTLVLKYMGSSALLRGLCVLSLLCTSEMTINFLNSSFQFKAIRFLDAKCTGHVREDCNCRILWNGECNPGRKYSALSLIFDGFIVKMRSDFKKLATHEMPED